MANKIGTIYPFICTSSNISPPSGTIFIDDKDLLIEGKFQDLYNIVGDLWSENPPAGHFNFKKLLGRVFVSMDLSQSEFNKVANVGGKKTHILSVPELATHAHYQSVSNYIQNTALGEYAHGFIGDGSYRETNTAGESQPHNNLQPYVVTRFVIVYVDMDINFSPKKFDVSGEEIVNAVKDVTKKLEKDFSLYPVINQNEISLNDKLPLQSDTTNKSITLNTLKNYIDNSGISLIKRTQIDNSSTRKITINSDDNNVEFNLSKVIARVIAPATNKTFSSINSPYCWFDTLENEEAINFVVTCAGETANFNSEEAFLRNTTQTHTVLYSVEAETISNGFILGSFSMINNLKSIASISSRFITTEEKDLKVISFALSGRTTYFPIGTIVEVWGIKK